MVSGSACAIWSVTARACNVGDSWFSNVSAAGSEAA